MEEEDNLVFHARQIIDCLKKTVVKLDKVIHEINEQTY